MLGPIGGKAEFVDITNDLEMPTALALLSYPYMGRTIHTLGAATRLDLESACRKAFSEAANDYARLVSELDALGGRWTHREDFSDITDFRRHSLLYTDPTMQHCLEFLTGSEETRTLATRPRPDLRSAREKLDSVVARLRQHFEEIVAIDLTTAEFEDLGVSVVKAIVPGAVPLHSDHRAPFLGHSRLYSAPARLGYRAFPSTAAELNPLPHPFA
jgi:ribosomal protein S12 methylthiotransferase accessory factor